jgi:hypothetical protein
MPTHEPVTEWCLQLPYSEPHFANQIFEPPVFEDDPAEAFDEERPPIDDALEAQEIRVGKRISAIQDIIDSFEEED